MASMSRPLQLKASRQTIEEIFLRARVGIDGDCHASPISPRQISLASTGACDYCDVPPESLREDILTKVHDLLSFMISFRLDWGRCSDSITLCQPRTRLDRIRPGFRRRHSS